MTAPTEREIRAAIERFLATDEQTINHLEDASGYGASGCTLDLWDRDDLRKSEEARLSELLSAAADRVDARVKAAMVEEFTAAALRFAEEHPNAPRAKVPA